MAKVTPEEVRNILGITKDQMSDERAIQIRDYIHSLCSNVIREELQKFKHDQSKDKSEN